MRLSPPGARQASVTEPAFDVAADADARRMARASVARMRSKDNRYSVPWKTRARRPCPAAMGPDDAWDHPEQPNRRSKTLPGEAPPGRSAVTTAVNPRESPRAGSTATGPAPLITQVRGEVQAESRPIDAAEPLPFPDDGVTRIHMTARQTVMTTGAPWNTKRDRTPVRARGPESGVPRCGNPNPGQPPRTTCRPGPRPGGTLLQGPSQPVAPTRSPETRRVRL